MPKIIIPISGIIAKFELENESNVTPKTLGKSLKAAKGKDILITINSPGGSVSSGLEMFSLIQNYSGNVETRIVSLAASMGSVLALAGNKMSAENTAMYFIHNAQGIGFGDYRELAKESKWLEDISILIANLYAEFTDLTLEEARDFMDDDSHFFGSDLELLGFEIIQTGNAANNSIARVKAKTRLAEVKNKISNEDYIDDLEKAVACIDYEKFGIKNTTPEKPTTINASVVENYGIKKPTGINIPEMIEKNNNLARVVIADIPASAGENKREVIMTLKEFLDQNPAANAEYKEAIVEAEKAGAEEVRKRSEQASKYLKAESKYPEAIKNLAVDVINGKSEITALTAAVAAYDGFMENQKSKDAQLETDNQGNTSAGGGELPAEDGTISNEVDLIAAAAADRKKAGLEDK